MKKRYLLPVIVFTVFLFLRGEKKEKNSLDLMQGISSSELSQPPTGHLSQLAFQEESISGEAPLLQTAIRYLNSKKEEWKIQGYHELRPKEISLPIGSKVIFSVFQEGVPVLDQEIQILVSKRGRVLSVQNQYRALEKADLSQKNDFSSLKNLSQKFEILSGETMSAYLYVIPGLSKPEVVFPVSVKNTKGDREELLVRASDGEIVAKSQPRKEF